LKFQNFVAESGEIHREAIFSHGASSDIASIVAPWQLRYQRARLRFDGSTLFALPLITTQETTAVSR